MSRHVSICIETLWQWRVFAQKISSLDWVLLFSPLHLVQSFLCSSGLLLFCSPHSICVFFYEAKIFVEIIAIYMRKTRQRLRTKSTRKKKIWILIGFLFREITLAPFCSSDFLANDWFYSNVHHLLHDLINLKHINRSNTNVILWIPSLAEMAMNIVCSFGHRDNFYHKFCVHIHLERHFATEYSRILCFVRAKYLITNDWPIKSCKRLFGTEKKSSSFLSIVGSCEVH